ncbi:hypothetical protein Poli38472_012545 [Pythium oligandrum]|uniref:Uncharacterized protein n=1 Tax=Pythium oligandrum TaxID=41045 RepID=A0A8K1CE31_PYTOL|nr:hypothetical protein Poli38472_012545 [Pythium oligandrum]|eukprot:TMW61354.1 hypothetical protein Poli38472_012545 [Pythium oligandrum]
MTNSTAASLATRKRNWNSVWQAPREETLASIANEIVFAFREPNEQEDEEEPDEIRTTEATSQSGDYLAVLQQHGDLASPARRKRRQHVTRDKQLDRLVWDVNDLRQEIQRYQEYHRALSTRLRYRALGLQDTLVRVTKEYFKMFHHGFLIEESKPDIRQTRFLQAIMIDNVVTCSKLTGLDALVEQWKRYAEYFQLLQYQMQSMSITSLDDEPIVQITCSYKVHITRKAMVELFPHVVADEFFMQGLIGKEMYCESRVTFHFNQDGKITRYDDDSDFVTAFSRIVRNPWQLTYLMQHARICEQSLIGELCEY